MLLAMPWYRQYFWLLLFGGIILLVAIISFVVICVCRTRSSKSVVRVQKSFRRNKRDESTIVTEKSIHHSSGPSKVKLPNRTERDFAVPEIPITVLPPKMYAMIQKESPQLPPRGLSVPGIPITVLPPKMNAMIQKESPQLPPRGLYPKHNAKKENTNSAISENPTTVFPHKINAMVHMGPPRVSPWGLYPEYYGKKENTYSHIPNPNDRYSNASYDSVGSISGYSNYSDSASAAVPREREYLEVIPDDDDRGYDDVEACDDVEAWRLGNNQFKMGHQLSLD